MEKFDLEKVQKLIDLAKKKHVTELSYEVGNVKISFSFATQQMIQYPATALSVAQGPHATTPPPDISEKKSNSTAGKYHELKAPFVGTFYTSAAPGEPTYVKVGDRVRVGQTVCILEAMKIMNQIESDTDGEIAEICLENESFAEYGQVLYRIKV